jgi:hypothetical protein
VPTVRQLREKLDHPRTPNRGRNPFVFADRRPVAPSAPGVGAARESEIAAPPLPADPPAARLRLSGIAASARDGVTVFTAILNDNGALVFANAGDRLSGGYQVVRVEETGVVIADAAGITQTIRLP